MDVKYIHSNLFSQGFLSDQDFLIFLFYEDKLNEERSRKKFVFYRNNYVEEIDEAKITKFAHFSLLFILDMQKIPHIQKILYVIAQLVNILL